MPSIYLLRHCDYYNPRNILPGRLPVPLSGEGRVQADKLRNFFASKDIGTIYTSAVRRCHETAMIIGGDKIAIKKDPRILETLSAYQGYWEENWHGDGYHFFSHQSELGGENLAMLQQRMADFWDELVVNLDQNVIICSHGDPLQVLYAYIHNLPLVDDNEQEANIPGWLEKGQFVEVVVQHGEYVRTEKVQSAE